MKLSLWYCGNFYAGLVAVFLFALGRFKGLSERVNRVLLDTVILHTSLSRQSLPLVLITPSK